MNRLSNRLFAACALTIVATPSEAQIPFDHVLSVELTDPNLLLPAFRIINPYGSGDSWMRDQRLFAPFNSLAIDPFNPDKFLFDNTASSFTGIWETTLENATHDVSIWGLFGLTPTRRFVVSPTNVYFLDANGLNSFPRRGGTGPTALIPIGNATDIAIEGSMIYVSEYSIAGVGQIIEYDTSNGTSRTVASLPRVLSIAVDTPTQLYAGTDSGDLLTIDVPTGQVTSTLSVANEPLRALAVTSIGLPVFSTPNAVWSLADLQNPLYSTPNPISDIDVARGGGAAMWRFARGCGAANAQPTWAIPSVPSVGNAGFSLDVESGPANAAAAVLVGTSRTFSVILGSALPVPLDAVGMPGCDLLVGPGLALPATLDSMGEASLPLPVGNQPSLIGLELFAQWIAADPSANALGFAVSEGAALLVR